MTAFTRPVPPPPVLPMPQTSVCFFCLCGLRACSEADDTVTGIRRRRLEPYCHLALAIYHGISAARAAQIGRETLTGTGPDRARRARYRAAIQAESRRGAK